MAKQTPATDTAPAEAVEDVTLDEFCLRLSNTDRRVEMIGGFHSDEKRAGRVKDAEAAYSTRYQAFVHKPA